MLLCQKQSFFCTPMHKILQHYIHQRTQHSGLMAKRNHVWGEMVRCNYSQVSYRDCLRNQNPQLQHCLGVPPIPSIRHQLWDGKQHQGKREVVDLILTADECEARAIFSIRLRPVWTLTNVASLKLYYPNKGHMVYIYTK